MTTELLTPTVTTEAPCAPCAYVAIHHWWGPSVAPGRSHCHECHRTWASTIEGHCTVCHRHFATYPAFDAHFIDDAHTDPAFIMRQDGRPKFTFRTTRFGVTWRLAFYGVRPDFTHDDDEEEVEGATEED
jgi:hypothetical protein